MALDRELIGKVIERETFSNPALGSWAALDRASKASRASIYRARDANPDVEVGTFRRIEVGLGLPYETLELIGAHDIESLEANGVRADLIAFVARSLNSETRKAQ